jgi:hypothetical protein
VITPMPSRHNRKDIPPLQVAKENLAFYSLIPKRNMDLIFLNHVCFILKKLIL